MVMFVFKSCALVFTCCVFRMKCGVCGVHLSTTGVSLLVKQRAVIFCFTGSSRGQVLSLREEHCTKTTKDDHASFIIITNCLLIFHTMFCVCGKHL